MTSEVDIKELHKLMIRHISAKLTLEDAKSFKDKVEEETQDGDKEFPDWLDPGSSAFLNIVDELLDFSSVSPFMKLFGFKDDTRE